MKYLILLITLCMSISCTRKENGTSTLSISIGDASGSLSAFQSVGGGGGMTFQSVSAQSASGDGPSWNTALNPSEALIDTDNPADTSNNINCIGITIDGPEPDMRRNTCTNSTTGTAFYVGRWVGGIPYSNGASIQLEVPSGNQRTIRVIGWHTLTGSCTDLKSSSSNSSNMSQPVVIGQKSMDFPSGNVNAAVSIPNTINSANIFDDCNGPDFNFGVGTQMYFGETLAANSLTINSGSPTDITSLSQPFRGAYAMLEGMAPLATGIGLDTSNPANFSVGDEVMIIIMGSKGTTLGPASTDYGSCGYRAFSGDYDFARIQSISGGGTINNVNYDLVISKGTFLDTLWKDSNINANEFEFTTTINGDDVDTLNTRLASAYTNSNFCRIQIVKVPHFYNLTVTTPSTFLQAPTFSWAAGGGILAFRVANNLSFDTSSGLDMSYKGYPGGATTLDGEGVQGRGGLNAGAGSGSGGGGGGGYGNAVGNAIGSPSGGAGSLGTLGGTSVGDDCDGSCTVNLKYKLFMGGGGGGASGAAGGSGGGIIFVAAKNFVPANSGGHIKSNGQIGSNSTDSAGGGAGGSILFINKTTTDVTKPMVNADGGNGGAATTDAGGGGGGGRIQNTVCKAGGVNQSFATTFVSAGIAGSGSSVGLAGFTGSIVAEDVLCP